MTTFELASFTRLRAAVETLQRRKEEELAKATSGVSALTGMPSAKGTVSDTVGNAASALADIDRMISEKLFEMESRMDEISSYIARVQDPIVFAAMTLHYVDGRTWTDTAMRIGGNTADSIRMEVKRYVRENP